MNMKIAHAAAHSARARAKAGATIRKIRAYKRKHGINWQAPLTDKQRAEALGQNTGRRSFQRGADVAKGVLDIAAIPGAKPPQAGAASAARRNILASRIDFGRQIVSFVDRLSARGQVATAMRVVSLLERMLTG